MARRGIAPHLFAVDVVTTAFATALGAGTLAVAAQEPAWHEVVTVCALVAFVVTLVAWLRTRLDVAAIRFVHDSALVIVLYVIYREVVLVARTAHGGRVYDEWLIAADRWLFGTDPTVWLQRFASPALTELLQVAYACFFALPIIVGAELYLTGPDGRFRRWLFVCGLGFLLGYVGYLCVPAIGPRFTLHGLGHTATDLPGLWLTPYLRHVIDAGGLVPAVVADAAAARGAARDAFPSGHAMMTLVSVWWSWREGLRTRWPLSIVGSLLVVATVYLRYHYVVDVIVGALLAMLVIAVGPALHRWVAASLGTRDAA
jgi:membrane-associated phospholipid phosphatase